MKQVDHAVDPRSCAVAPRAWQRASRRSTSCRERASAADRRPTPEGASPRRRHQSSGVTAAAGRARRHVAILRDLPQRAPEDGRTGPRRHRSGASGRDPGGAGTTGKSRAQASRRRHASRGSAATGRSHVARTGDLARDRPRPPGGDSSQSRDGRRRFIG